MTDGRDGLTYPEVCGTRGGRLPDGYRHVRRHERLGTGEAVFAAAVAGLRSFDIRAFSRPAAWYGRLGRPFVNLLQDFVTDRYVRALRRLATGGER